MKVILSKGTWHKQYNAEVQNVNFTFCEGYVAVSVSGTTEKNAFLIKGSLINTPVEFLSSLSAGTFDFDKELHILESHIL